MQRRRNNGASRGRSIKLSGALTDAELASTRTALLSALRSADVVTLDCTALASAGIGLIQLILSASRLADVAGKGLSFTQPIRGPLLAALQRAGFISASETEAAADPACWPVPSAADALQRALA